MFVPLSGLRMETTVDSQAKSRRLSHCVKLPPACRPRLSAALDKLSLTRLSPQTPLRCHDEGNPWRTWWKDQIPSQFRRTMTRPTFHFQSTEKPEAGIL